MAFESSHSKEMQRLKKISSISAIAENGGHLKGFLAAPKSWTTFFISIINYCRGLREGLVTLTSFTLTNNHCRGLREGLGTLTFSILTNNYCRSLKKELETQTSSAYTNNSCCGLKKGLETQIVFTTSISLIRGFNIPKNIPFSIEPTKTGYNL